MEMRKLGRFEVSVVGLGCNNFGRRCDERQSAEVVDAALEEGINLFDTADVYGEGLSEAYLGRALQRRRDEVVIATKFGHQMGQEPLCRGGSARWIATAIEDSLRRLGTDRIDLYQLHTPDPETPIEETLEALDGLVRAGKVLEIGSSNFSGEEVAHADTASSEHGWTRFISAQNHYNLLERTIESDVLKECEWLGIRMIPYYPLASGMLTGKYRRGEAPLEGTRLAGMQQERRDQMLRDRNFDVVERLQELATERRLSLVDVAIAWLAAQPTVVSVIAGATKPAQVRTNSNAGRTTLSPEDLAEIDSITAR